MSPLRMERNKELLWYEENPRSLIGLDPDREAEHLASLEWYRAAIAQEEAHLAEEARHTEAYVTLSQDAEAMRKIIVYGAINKDEKEAKRLLVNQLGRPEACMSARRFFALKYVRRNLHCFRRWVKVCIVALWWEKQMIERRYRNPDRAGFEEDCSVLV